MLEQGEDIGELVGFGLHGGRLGDGLGGVKEIVFGFCGPIT